MSSILDFLPKSQSSQSEADSSHDKSVERDQKSYTEELPYDTNVFREMAREREYPEVNHAHVSGISDGKDPIAPFLENMGSRGIPYVAFTDHADPGYLFDERGFYGSEGISNPEGLKEGVSDSIKDIDSPDLVPGESFDVHIALGMELNYHPDVEEEIREFLNEYEDLLDLVLVAIHHDSEGRNIGRASEYGVGDDPEEVWEDIRNITEQGIDFAAQHPLTYSIVHPYRAENNRFVRQAINPGGVDPWKGGIEAVSEYNELYSLAAKKGIFSEFNAKTSLRSLLHFNEPPGGERVLLEGDFPKTAGPDLHRVSGNSSRSITR